MKRRGKRLCNAALQALRPQNDRPIAWEDQVRQLLLRCEPIQPGQFGMKLMAHTVIKVRKFCGG
jgi:hypothetical protein